MARNHNKRGKAIAEASNQIKHINEKEYAALSQSTHGVYEVPKTSIGSMCQCPDHVYRGVKCNHVFAVEFSSQIRKEVQIRTIQPEVGVQACQF